LPHLNQSVKFLLFDAQRIRKVRSSGLVLDIPLPTPSFSPGAMRGRLGSPLSARESFALLQLSYVNGVCPFPFSWSLSSCVSA